MWFLFLLRTYFKIGVSKVSQLQLSICMYFFAHLVFRYLSPLILRWRWISKSWSDRKLEISHHLIARLIFRRWRPSTEFTPQCTAWRKTTERTSRWWSRKRRPWSGSREWNHVSCSHLCLRETCFDLNPSSVTKVVALKHLEALPWEESPSPPWFCWMKPCSGLQVFSGMLMRPRL